MSVETPTPQTPPAPAAAAAAATATPAVPAVPAPPATVTVPVEAWQSYATMQARITQLETEQKQRETAATEERIRLLTEKGQAETAVKTLREQKDQELTAEKNARATIEDRAKRYALDGEVSRVLAGQPLVPGAAEQLTKLWRSEFQVEPQGDSFVVRTPTFQSVGDFVAAQLARPEYAHFVRAQNPGGGTGGVSPAGQTAPTQAANAAAPIVPKTLSDAVIYTMQQMKQGATDGRTDTGGDTGRDRRAGFGLRPLAKQG